MKILVLSDSHASLRFMRTCLDQFSPDMAIHLGDYYEDGAAMASEYPHIPFVQVPGNCDRYRHGCENPEILIRTISGVVFYITHGHRHNVKLYTVQLLKDARLHQSDIVLYGHTHQQDCYCTEDGLWVLNPGSCGFSGGSAGFVEIEDHIIKTCRIIHSGELEV